MCPTAAKTLPADLGQRPSLSVIVGGKSSCTPSGFALPSKDIIALGSVLALLQLADGVLTGIGIFNYGVSMEGNALLRALMGLVGWMPALILVKGLSIGLVAILCHQASSIKWLRPAFCGVIVLYLMMAVVPWTYILLSDLLA